jgi:hypothetical protein
MNPVKTIIPIGDAEAARMLTDDAFAGLAEQIMSVPVPEHGAARRPAGRRALARRWLIGIPVAAGLTVATLAAAVIVQLGPGGAGAAQALAFARHGRWIDVTVRDAFAAPQVYRAEFRAHGLKIKLSLVPASPSVIGILDGYKTSGNDNRIKPLMAKNCRPGGSCPIGLRIPLDYHGSAALMVGRPAKPGETYAITGPATALGEVMHGLRVRGQTVAAVLAMLQRRHATVARFDYETTHHDQFIPPSKVVKARFENLVPWTTAGRLVPASKVLGTWFVYGGVPWAPGQVMLMVGPTRTIQPAPAHRHSAATPSSSPSPAASSRSANGTGTGG